MKLEPLSRTKKKALLASLNIAGALIIILGLVTFCNHCSWLFLFAFGVALCFYAGRELSRDAEIRNGLQVQGRILATSIGEVMQLGAVDYIEYYPNIKFEYATPEGLMVADGYSISAKDYRNLDRIKIEKILADYPLYKDVIVYVSPQNYSLAALQPNISSYRRNHNIALLISGILIAGVSLLLGYLLAN